VRILITLSLFALSTACSSSETAAPTTTDSSVAHDTLASETADETAPAEDAASDETPRDATCSLVKPYSTKDKVCNDCAAEKCCAEVNDCLGDKRCDDDYVNCILACALLPDDAGDAGGCIGECGTKYPEGKALYDTAIACVEEACPDCM
jgi:hypothetical protein